MSDPQVTIVVVPRERFSFAQRCLSTIYQHTKFPFDLVYVDTRSPSPVKRFLEQEAQQKGLRILSTDDYLSPNQARNLAWREVRTKYTVFLENDMLVTPGWLDALVQCAEETGAWIVGPLYLIGEIERQTIHMAGGTIQIKEHDGRRVLYDEQYLFETRIADVQAPLRRQEWDYVEFHCMLLRTDLHDRLGPLDEKLSHHEHIDICMAVRKAGGSVYVEPKAVTAYVPPPPCEWWDLPYFMLRWSEAWNVASARHFNEKWDVSCVRFFTDKAGSDDEHTIVGWARGQRRMMTGLRVPAAGMDYLPELPLEQAELMVAIFQSVDRDYFDLALTTDQGIIELSSELTPQAVLNQLPAALRKAEERQLSVMLRPLRQARPNEAVHLRIDKIDSARLSKVQPYSFLTLETSPEQYQCVLAVDHLDWRATAALARSGASATADSLKDFIGLAGSRSAESGRSLSDNASHRITLIEARTGLLSSIGQLERKGVLPYLTNGRIL
jgi:GT2 family glycosyltransferase